MFKLTALIDSANVVLNMRTAFDTLPLCVTEKIKLEIFSAAEIDKDEKQLYSCKKSMSTADLLFFNFHGSMAYFKSYIKFTDEFSGKKPYFFYSSIESEMEEMTRRCKLPNEHINTILSYLEAGGADNYREMLGYISDRIAAVPYEFKPAVFPKRSGIYKLENNMTEDDYIAFCAGCEKPVIGILLHFYNIQRNDTEHIDMLIEKIKDCGCVPLAVYSSVAPSGDVSYGGLHADLRRYMTYNGKTVVHSLIITSGHSLSLLSAPGDGVKRVDDSVFEILGVPALHALTTNFTYEKWLESVRGMDSMYLGNVYTAEYDGQLVTVVFACTEQIKTPHGIKDVMKPIEDRAAKIVRLAKNYALLKFVPNNEKKVAIILHNMPPRADMIGCAYGLDTPQSVYNIFARLKENGFTTDYDFADGRELIDKIIAGLTNDGRFSSADEMLRKAEAVVTKSDWEKWFYDLPEKAERELKRDWGEAPGEFMTVGEKILVPCIINGNILIGLQPPRALEEKAEECYHSTDIVCPWQYLAFYRYVEKIFGANIIVHVGTHGTIEWLPGKEIGLSQSCYPDLAIGDLPHLYPYIIDVPGEGAQAKRRTAATVIDHLIPSMTESGAYSDIAVIDDLIAKYYHARQNDNSKTALISDEIWENAVKQGLDKDLSISAEEFSENTETVMEKLHLWVSEIKCSEIKDGLHIFGLPPQNERMKNMLRLLVRVRNGSIPSLRESLCCLNGYDVDELIENPQKVNTDGKTNAILLEEIDEQGRRLFDIFERGGYSGAFIDSAIAEFCGENRLSAAKSDKLRKCLCFVSERVYPSLLSTTDELAHFMDGINGDFVLKGPSGAPSRGNAHILPTGRNFYTIDPCEVPSRASWETGKRLAKQLLKQYEEENGEIPESVAIVVYAGETMKTNGDDIAEVLYLYGIKPVWLGETDRVVGLEVIPLNELNRPRIDVTLRISGLFRDTFPNLIELVDEAVNIAAALDEADSDNFIHKHVSADIAKFMEDGFNREQAYERASVRIFGCPPGTYGAGVDIMINSRKWETSDDLGNAYITWSGHGYSRKIHGDKLQDLFSHRLGTVDATVKNISSCEADMLDSDDFYNYHGGLIAAVKKQRGVLPSSYSTNAADINHVVTKNIHTETARIMRARINNPKWIEGLKKHGFKGAQEFSAMVDIVFGWDATSNVIDDYMYDSIFDTYLHDKDLCEWIKKENPYALHAMSERLLEAVQRGMWNAGDDKTEELRQIYLEMEGSFEGE